MSGIRLGRNTGLNPSIPLCPYCGEGKNEIVLTGAEGEKWAKEHGNSDGYMPMYIHLEGDIEPCDKCKEKGIAIVEVKSDSDKSLTGNRWLVKEDFIKRLITDAKLLKSILSKRLVMIPEEVTHQIGLRV